MKLNRTSREIVLELVRRPSVVAILVIGFVVLIITVAHYEAPIRRLIATARPKSTVQMQSSQANHQQQGNRNNTQNGSGNSQQNGNVGPSRNDHNQVVNGNNNHAIQVNR